MHEVQLWLCAGVLFCIGLSVGLVKSHLEQQPIVREAVAVIINVACCHYQPVATHIQHIYVMNLSLISPTERGQMSALMSDFYCI